jgi:hypothetical protein
VGHIRQFDGTTLTLIGTKEMDVREGSAFALDCANRQKLGELAMQRRHIVSHAETKARLRAIASLGIRRSYSKEELLKPFVCAKLSFTGRSDDPELRRAFALKRADAFLSSSNGLYGAPPTLPPALGMAPPPVGTIPDEVEDMGDDSPPPRRAATVAGPYTPPAAAKPAQPTPAPAQNVRPPSSPPAASSAQQPMPYAGGRPAAPPAPQRQRSGCVLPGGPSKGQAVEDASDESLAYWSKRIADGLEKGTARRGDEALYDALCKEIAYRAAKHEDWQPDELGDDDVPF